MKSLDDWASPCLSLFAVVTKVEEPNIQTIAENQDGVNENKDPESQPFQKEVTIDDYALYEVTILYVLMTKFSKLQ